MNAGQNRTEPEMQIWPLTSDLRLLTRVYPRKSAANFSICFLRVGIHGEFLLESLHWNGSVGGGPDEP